MPNHHDHSHRTSNIKLAFFLNLAFTIFEFVGGWLVNSVAIMSDALHDLGDSLSLGLSWYLDRKSKKGSNKRFTFGYGRFSLLGALVNSLVLLIGSVFIVNEAIQRIMFPEHSDALGMLGFAIVGVLVNGYAAWKVSKGKTLNERVISLHLLEDVLGWAAVLIVAIVLLFQDVHYLDPALSLLITLWILWNVVRRLKETVLVFLQGKPKELDLEEIKQRLLSLDRVHSLHHTHCWSLDGEHHVFSTHVLMEHIMNFDDIKAVKNEMKRILADYPLSHTTIEAELDEQSCSLQ